jgi:hypothetical protein
MKDRITINQLERDVMFLDSKVTQLMKALKDHQNDEHAHKV